MAKTQDAWEQRQLSGNGETEWATLKVKSAMGRQRFRVLEDGSVLVSGPLVDKDDYVIEAATDANVEISAIRLEALQHESLTGKGLSRASSGNFVLTEIEVFVNNQPQKIASGEASFEQGGWNVGGAFDGKSETGWAVYPGKNVEKEEQALFVFEKPISASPDKVLKILLKHESPHEHHNLGRFRLSVTANPKPTLDGRDAKLVEALKAAPDKRTKEQKDLIAKTHRESDDQYTKLNKELETARNALSGHRNSIPKVMVMEESLQPRQTFILDRGLYNEPTDTEVKAAVPAVFQQLPEDEPANRLALAKWLVHRDNPLTSRVTVNRFWQQIFGVGLVKTSNDFGVQAEFPVHPELLDWLAVDFMENGWDVKRLLTQIVTSNAYRRSAKIDSPVVFENDPENRLIARGPRFRMPSWMIRDQALASSGLLVDQIGGKPVNTYQPEGIWEEATFGKKKYSMDSGDALYRRSIYTFWRRIVGPTMFFDAGKRQVCEVTTTRTNTPMHALTTLNDITFVEAARALAQRSINSAAADDDTRIRQAVSWVLARDVTDGELAIWRRSLKRARDEFTANPNQAEA
ncbi:MAG: DUF1553 domain-containing protein, partial [Verrucomicrobiota bacterium]